MAITIVQHASGFISTAWTSITATFGSNTTVGNTIIVVCSTTTSATVSGITIGSNADNFAQVIFEHNTAGNAQNGQIWADFNLQTSSTAIAVTITPSELGGIDCFEVSGLAGCWDVTSVAQGSPATTATTGTSGTSRYANELVMAMVQSGSPTTTMTPTGSTTVASGSNGGTISLVASWAHPSAGVLDVAASTNFSSGGGTAYVTDSSGNVATITYTGTGTGTLTGCAYVGGSPSGTVATGGLVSSTAWQLEPVVTYGSTYKQSTAYQITTSTGTYSYTATTTNQYYVGVLVSFPAAAQGFNCVFPQGFPVVTRATSGSVTGTWGTGQPRTAGDLLIAYVAAIGSTSTTLPSPPTGWNSLVTATNSPANAACGYWYLIATGGDSPPTFTATISGTAAMMITLMELNGTTGASSTPDATGTYTSGASSTIASMTVTASTNTSNQGELALAGFVREQGTAAVATWTPGTGFTNATTDGTTSSRGHAFLDRGLNPATAAGVSDAGTVTSAATSFAAGVIAVFAPPSSAPAAVVPPVRAVYVSAAVNRASNW